ncbi:MAG: hypothetical protein MUC59_11795, partial [Saprospiraceae bacterium]|nr:hypothetical protein [Saprospiraceae bacterium]
MSYNLQPFSGSHLSFVKNAFMNKSFVLSTCLVFCFYANMDACDCLPIPTFCESIVDADNGQLWEQLSVHHIKVLSAQPNSLTIKVKKSFAGENLEGLQRTILDGNGANCILFASINLAVGEEYIIASTGGSDTILLSECGLSFLKVVNGEVIGAIAPG